MQIASLYIYYGRKISVRCKIYTQIDFKSHKFTRVVNFYNENDNWSPRRLQQNSCQMNLLDVPMCSNVNRLSNFIPAERFPFSKQLRGFLESSSNQPFSDCKRDDILFS